MRIVVGVIDFILGSVLLIIYGAASNDFGKMTKTEKRMWLYMLLGGSALLVVSGGLLWR